METELSSLKARIPFRGGVYSPEQLMRRDCVHLQVPVCVCGGSLYLRIMLNFWSSLLFLLSAEIIGVCYLSWFMH